MARAAKSKVGTKKSVERAPKRSQAERKSKAIELLLQAIASGWTVERFARLSGVHRATLFRWVAEDSVQPRYMRAMQIKALALPDRADDILNKILTGQVDPKAGRVVLSHLEFRIMRENKALYHPTRDLNVKTSSDDISDQELDDRIAAYMAKAGGATGS